MMGLPELKRGSENLWLRIEEWSGAYSNKQTNRTTAKQEVFKVKLLSVPEEWGSLLYRIMYVQVLRKRDTNHRHKLLLIAELTLLESDGLFKTETMTSLNFP